MKQEDKELLLKDLCARLPYGFTIYRHSDNADLKISDIDDFAHFLEYSDGEEFKPYLRPMSSMTEEEKKKLKADTCPEGTGYFDEKYLLCPVNHYGEYISYEFMSAILGWLNSNHFDYLGLIEKGLALEAPEGMYDLTDK